MLRSCASLAVARALLAHMNIVVKRLVTAEKGSTVGKQECTYSTKQKCSTKMAI
jgi:hypothetical protein